MNDDFERRTDELAKQAKRNADELEKLEANLQQTEIDAINKMDAELIRFLSSDEEESKITPMDEKELSAAAKKIFDDFTRKTEALRREYEEAIKKILKEIEERKIRELKERLRNLP